MKNRLGAFREPGRSGHRIWQHHYDGVLWERKWMDEWKKAPT